MVVMLLLLVHMKKGSTAKSGEPLYMYVEKW